jgi:hypothetical protein
MIMTCPYKADIFKLIDELKAEGHDIALAREGCYWYLEDSRFDKKFFQAGDARRFYEKLLDFAKGKGVPVNE